MFLNSRKIGHNPTFFLTSSMMEGDNNHPKCLTIFVFTCNKLVWTLDKTKAPYGAT